MKLKIFHLLIFFQLLILFVLIMLDISNEIFDLPHVLFGDKPTAIGERKAEMVIEITIYIIAVSAEYLVMDNLLKRVKTLEGFIPICANCKKVRQQENWEQIETYISKHTLAEFTHSICPDCMKKLYPEFYNKTRKKRAAN